MPETKWATFIIQYIESLYCSSCKALAFSQKRDFGGVLKAAHDMLAFNECLEKETPAAVMRRFLVGDLPDLSSEFFSSLYEL